MGDIYEFNNFNAGAGYISPPVAGSLNLADPPPKIDKIISGFVALAIIEALPENLTAGLQLPEAGGMKKVLWIAIGIIAGVAVALVSFFLTRGG